MGVVIHLHPSGDALAKTPEFPAAYLWGAGTSGRSAEPTPDSAEPRWIRLGWINAVRIESSGRAAGNIS